MEVFKYHTSDTYEQNFTRWHTMNTKERSIYREEPLNEIDAKTVFYSLYLDHYESEKSPLCNFYLQD